MPGAWEKNTFVMGAILHTDNTTMQWAFGFRRLQFPGEFMPFSGMPFDHARNAAAMKALEVGASHLFFMDSDVIIPPDGVMRLLARNEPIISGLYNRRSPPAGIPVMIRNGQWVTDYKPGSIVEVDLVGSGCLLIRRDVLETMKEPVRPGKQWFSWQVDLVSLLPPGEALSEDFAFCAHARRRYGYKVLVDTSVECRHIGYSQFRHNQMAPLEF